LGFLPGPGAATSTLSAQPGAGKQSWERRFVAGAQAEELCSCSVPCTGNSPACAPSRRRGLDLLGASGSLSRPVESESQHLALCRVLLGAALREIMVSSEPVGAGRSA